MNCGKVSLSRSTASGFVLRLRASLSMNFLCRSRLPLQGLTCIFSAPMCIMWQNLHAAPSWQPATDRTKAQGLHLLLLCSLEPRDGKSQGVLRSDAWTTGLTSAVSVGISTGASELAADGVGACRTTDDSSVLHGSLATASLERPLLPLVAIFTCRSLGTAWTSRPLPVSNSSSSRWICTGVRNAMSRPELAKVGSETCRRQTWTPRGLFTKGGASSRKVFLLRR
mmetsp:Transcript_46669/g.117408  ORF Transcript_46669/g.117408 Transcript_46669/m.117408 type:complete len:225 (-) Transcript_46669:123-797(-)